MGRAQEIATRTLFSCFSLVVGWGVYTYVIVPGGAFSWDECAHALRGLSIAEDLKKGDWLGFLYDTYRQVYWPPLHSWLAGAAFLIAGPSTVSARTVGLVTYLLAAAAMYVASLQFERRSGDVAAAVAATLFLTSPAVVAAAAQSMLEMPALLCMILTIVAYFHLTNAGQPPRPHVLLGLGVAATYFAKSNYGVLLAMAIVFAALIEGRFRPRALFTRAHAYAALPLLIAFSVWFAYPPRLLDTWRAMVNQPFGVNDPFGVESVFFYPVAFLRMCGSPWIVAMLLVSFAAVLRFARDRNVRFLIVLVVLQGVIGQIHHTKVARHILPIMPVLFLLTGYVVAKWWNARSTNALPRWLPGVVTALLLVHSARLFADALYPVRYAYDRETLERIMGAIPKDAPTLVIGTMDMRNPSPPIVDWQLGAEERAFDMVQSGVIVDWEVIQRMLAAMHASSTPRLVREPLSRVFGRYERPARLRSLYLGLPHYTSYSRSAEGFSAFVRSLAKTFPFDSAVVVTSIAEDVRWPVEFVDGGLRGLGLEPASSARLDDVKLRIDVYRRGL